MIDIWMTTTVIAVAAAGFLCAKSMMQKQRIHALESQEKAAVLVATKLQETELELRLAEERCLEMQRRIEDWEKARAESLQHAKAAIFDVGSQLSNKLLAEHRREAEMAKKQSEERVKQTTLSLYTHFEQVVQAVAVLGDQVKSSKETVDIVKQALLSPGGAGSLAEMTLENILRASGLTSGRDYMLQHTLTGAGEGQHLLRPDALVFLPGENVMIIDSKASKFFIDRFVQPEEEQAGIDAKLKLRMQQHLKDLNSREYQQAVRSHCESLQPPLRTQHVSTILFVPSDTALETLQMLDASFMEKAWQAQIFPVGPAGLIHILAHARFQIAQVRQSENHEKIMQEVRKLLGAVSQLQEHSRKLGKGLQGAFAAYDKFAASFNANLLSKARKLTQLGVELPPKAALPTPLERHQIIAHAALVEGESEVVDAELEEALLLEDA
jgi:DNA recombination protein RmuC